MRQVGGMKMRYNQDPHPWVGDPKKDNHNYRDSPQGVWGLSPTSGSLAQGSYTRKTKPQNVWL